MTLPFFQGQTLTAAFLNNDVVTPLATGVAQLSWPSAAGAIVTNGLYQLSLSWPWPVGSVISMTCETANGSFVAAVQINGVAISGLGAVLVNTPSPATSLPGVNELVLGNSLTLLVSAATGSPTDATVQVAFTRSAF